MCTGQMSDVIKYVYQKDEVIRKRRSNLEVYIIIILMEMKCMM